MLEETIGQLAQRGVRLFDNTTAMKTQFDQSLKIDSPAPDKLTLEYRFTDPDTAVLVLESLDRAFLGYQMHDDRKADRPNSIKLVEAAAHDAQPVVDQRTFISIMVFVISAVSALVLTFLLRWWLLRNTRVFGDAENSLIPQLENEEAWPELTTMGKREDMRDI